MHPPAKPTGGRKKSRRRQEGKQVEKGCCKGAAWSRAGLGSTARRPLHCQAQSFAVNASSSLKVKNNCGERWRFRQQPKPEETSANPKATPRRSQAGLPNFHHAVLGAAGREDPARHPLPVPRTPTRKKPSPTCKPLQPCPPLRGAGKAPSWPPRSSAGLSRRIPPQEEGSGVR